MLNPAVLAHNDDEDNSFNGYVNPWSLRAAYRSPSFGQALYPDLKTHMLEHHWLQDIRTHCNPGLRTPGNINCEPYFFNHGRESSPATLFYDGHVETVGVGKAMRADGRVRTQTGLDNWGLWSRDTAFGADGYLIELADWNPEVAAALAQIDGVELTQAHWQVLEVVRAFQAETGISPSMRPLVKLVREHLGDERGTSLYLLELFPGNPAKVAARIAGLPRPSHCI